MSVSILGGDRGNGFTTQGHSFIFNYDLFHKYHRNGHTSYFLTDVNSNGSVLPQLCLQKDFPSKINLKFPTFFL